MLSHERVGQKNIDLIYDYKILLGKTPSLDKASHKFNCSTYEF